MNTKNDDFEEVFNSSEVPAELPEDTTATEPKEAPKKKGLSLIFKIVIGIVILVVLIIVLTIAFSSPGKKKTIHDLPQLEQQTAPLIQDDLKAENDQLKALLSQAKSSVAVRDKKYRELKSRSDAQAKEIADLKQKLAEKGNEQPAKQDTRPEMPQLKGVSLHSIYKGYAFIKKGKKIFSVTPGESVNGARVIEIDPEARLVVTSDGVIK